MTANGPGGSEADLAEVVAAADLVDRTGAVNFTLGYEEGDPITWYAQATYRGARLFASGQPTPEEAATALCVRLLTGAACKCGRKVALRAGTPGCLWRLVGRRWTPGCDSPPIDMPASSRGDVEAMRRAFNERVASRERRAS